MTIWHDGFEDGYNGNPKACGLPAYVDGYWAGQDKAAVDAEQDDIGNYDERGPVTFSRGTRGERTVY